MCAMMQFISKIRKWQEQKMMKEEKNKEHKNTP